MGSGRGMRGKWREGTGVKRGGAVLFRTNAPKCAWVRADAALCAKLGPIARVSRIAFAGSLFTNRTSGRYVPRVVDIYIIAQR